MVFFQLLPFVEVLLNGSKLCKLQRICLKHASNGDFGTILGKRKNAMRRRKYQYFVCSQFAKNTQPKNTADYSPAWNSVDFGQTSAS